jgi:hypothetical protein
MEGESNDWKSQVHALVGKAATDDEFVNLLLDPRTRPEALKAVGIEPTAENLHEVTHALNHMREVWQAFRGDDRMAS